MGKSIKQAQQNADQLKTVMQILSGARNLMQNPRVSTAHKELIIQETLKDYPQASSFVCVLLGAHRLGLLEEIYAQVQTLLDDRKGVSRAVVTSAQVLNQAQQKAAQKALSARYGKTIEAVFKTDKSLIGGLKFMCNGELIDGTIKRQLERLEQEITK